MSVKRSQSGSRILAALEAIAKRQPIGVSELARVLKADKSAVQRAIMTLADSGWICPAPGTPTRWQLTSHILMVARMGHISNDLRQRARATLEALRDESQETVLLTVPDIRRFVVIDVMESRQLLRTAPHVGMTVPVRGSGASRALLPYMTSEEREEMLGASPDAAMLEDFAATIERGYSVSAGDVVPGSTNIGAPIFEVDGAPAGAIVVSAPSDRLSIAQHPVIGAMVSRAAKSLSRGAPVNVLHGIARESRPALKAGRSKQ